jgi:hypothetical protein
VRYYFILANNRFRLIEYARGRDKARVRLTGQHRSDPCGRIVALCTGATRGRWRYLVWDDGVPLGQHPVVWVASVQGKTPRELLRDDFTHYQAGYSASELYQLGQLSSDEFIAVVGAALGGRLTHELITTKLMAEMVGESLETVRLLALLARFSRLGGFSNTHNSRGLLT